MDLWFEFDFNFHIYSPQDSTVKSFSSLLKLPKHQDGNTLDFIVTRADEQLINDLAGMPDWSCFVWPPTGSL